MPALYRNISEYSGLDSSSTIADYNSAQSYDLPSGYSDSTSLTDDQSYDLSPNSPNDEYKQYPREGGNFEISNSGSNGIDVTANNGGNMINNDKNIAKNYTDILTAENKGKNNRLRIWTCSYEPQTYLRPTCYCQCG